jgi:hypothetical protein
MVKEGKVRTTKVGIPATPIDQRATTVPLLTALASTTTTRATTPPHHALNPRAKAKDVEAAVLLKALATHRPRVTARTVIVLATMHANVANALKMRPIKPPDPYKPRMSPNLMMTNLP